MAYFRFCNTPTANLVQTPTHLLPLVQSIKTAAINRNGKTPIKLNSILGKQFFASKPSYHTIKHIDKFMEPSVEHSFPLKIGIIGLGEFGQFLAKAFKRQGHNILGTSRSDYSEYCQQHGIEFFRDLDDLCEEQPDILLVCSSILSTENIVRKIPFHKLKSNTIIADVLSVKQFPMNLFLDVVPSGFGILCTHPMFGKFSGKNSWEGLRFVYDKVKIAENSIQEKNCQQFLNIFQDEGCNMVEMSCKQHDEYAAESQFVTHTIARVLSQMDLVSTPVDTKGYETLMTLTQNTTSHSSDLFEGLYLYNVNATKQIEKLERAFETVKQNLYGKVREAMRKKIDETFAASKTSEGSQPSYFLPFNDNVKDLSSFSMVSDQQGNQDAAIGIQSEVHHATL